MADGGELKRNMDSQGKIGIAFIKIKVDDALSANALKMLSDEVKAKRFPWIIAISPEELEGCSVATVMFSCPNSLEMTLKRWYEYLPTSPDKPHTE